MTGGTGGGTCFGGSAGLFARAALRRLLRSTACVLGVRCRSSLLTEAWFPTFAREEPRSRCRKKSAWRHHSTSRAGVDRLAGGLWRRGFGLVLAAPTIEDRHRMAPLFPRRHFLSRRKRPQKSDIRQGRISATVPGPVPIILLVLLPVSTRLAPFGVSGRQFGSAHLGSPRDAIGMSRARQRRRSWPHVFTTDIGSFSIDSRASPIFISTSSLYHGGTLSAVTGSPSSTRCSANHARRTASSPAILGVSSASAPPIVFDSPDVLFRRSPQFRIGQHG